MHLVKSMVLRENKLLCLLLALLIAPVFSFSQITSIVGKWKPVKFEMVGLVKADVVTGAIEYIAPLDSLFKNDKNPQESKQMMELIYQMMVGKFSKTVEEFTATKKYLVTDIVKNKIKESTYEFDAVKKELRVVDVDSKKENIFKIIFTEKGFTTSSEIGSPTNPKDKGIAIVTYEKA